MKTKSDGCSNILSISVNLPFFEGEAELQNLPNIAPVCAADIHRQKNGSKLGTNLALRLLYEKEKSVRRTRTRRRTYCCSQGSLRIMFNVSVRGSSIQIQTSKVFIESPCSGTVSPSQFRLSSFCPYLLYLADFRE